MIVTNGIAPHTTIAVITAKPSSGFANQSWWAYCSKPSCASVQLRTPNSKSTIQLQMVTATTGGIDHASTSPVVISRRMNAPSRASRSAISVPKSIVRPTVTAVNTIVRRSTVQN